MSEKTVAILKQEVRELELYIRNALKYVNGIGYFESLTDDCTPPLVKIRGTIEMLPLMTETFLFKDLKNFIPKINQDKDQTKQDKVEILDFTDKNKSKEDKVKDWIKLYNWYIDPFFHKFIDMYRVLFCCEHAILLTTKYNAIDLCWWQIYEGADPTSKIEEIIECLHILLANTKKKLQDLESQNNNVKRSSDKQKMSPHKIYLHQNDINDCKFYQIIKRKSKELVFLKDGNQDYTVLDILYNADNHKASKKEILTELDKVDEEGNYTDKDKAGLSTLITRLNNELLKYFKIDHAIVADELNTSYELKIPIHKDYDFGS